MNDPTVHANFAAVNNDFREELARQYREWQQSVGQQVSDDDCKKIYDEIVRLHLEGMKQKVSSFISTHEETLRRHLTKQRLSTTNWGQQLAQSAETLKHHVAAMTIDTSQFDGFP